MMALSATLKIVMMALNAKLKIVMTLNTKLKIVMAMNAKTEKR